MIPTFICEYILLDAALGEKAKIGLSAGNWNLVEQYRYEVVRGNAYQISADDFAKFSSDNKDYSLKLENGGNGSILFTHHSHTWATDWSSDANGHWHACTAADCGITDYSKCGETGAAYGEHVYDNDQDATCNTCSYARTLNKEEQDAPAASLFTVTDVPADGQTGAIAVSADAQKLEYRPVTEPATEEWKPVTESGESATLSALAEGKYDFRYKETETHKASPATTVEIKKLTPQTASVAIAQSEHGTVTSQPAVAAAGETVTLRVAPDEAYKLDSLTIKTEGGDEITASVSAEDENTYTFTMPQGGVRVSAVFTAVSAPVEPTGPTQPTQPVRPSRPIWTGRPAEKEPQWPFVDVAKRDWCYDSVKYVYEQGLMAGFDKNHFCPEASTSRAMLATVLWRLAGEPKSTGALCYSDCDANGWYAGAVAWGTENGVLRGYADGTFDPGAPVTREQLAAMLYRYAQKTGADVSKRTALDGFSDAGEVSSYAQTAMQWVVANGIVAGRGRDLLAPKAGATRAETAAMLERFVRNVVKQ